MEFGAAMFFTDYSLTPAELGQALEARGFGSVGSGLPAGFCGFLRTQSQRHNPANRHTSVSKPHVACGANWVAHARSTAGPVCSAAPPRGAAMMTINASLRVCRT